MTTTKMFIIRKTGIQLMLVLVTMLVQRIPRKVVIIVVMIVATSMTTRVMMHMIHKDER